jgi:hypothetical protein
MGLDPIRLMTRNIRFPTMVASNDRQLHSPRTRPSQEAFRLNDFGKSNRYKSETTVFASQSGREPILPGDFHHAVEQHAL